MEVRTMKSRLALSIHLFLASSCMLAGLSKPAWGAAPAVPATPDHQESSQSAESTELLPSEQAEIPGPLRSFLRMAAISQKVSPEEVLPLLARNVVVSGYQNGTPTEFLVLVNWYMDQARELVTLAGREKMIRVSRCEDAKPLLSILGYKLRQSCGPDAALETSDANRAFLT